jgi:hypothetical protein
MNKKEIISILCALALAASLGGCGGYVDLDLTLFHRVDLTQAIPESAYDLDAGELPAPGEPLRLSFTQATQVDLSDQINHTLSDQIDAIFLESIRYRVPENALGAGLSGVGLWIAPLETPGPQHRDAIHLGMLGELGAGEVVEARPFPVTTAGHAALQRFLKEGRFVVFLSGEVLAEGVEASERPAGAALIEVDIVGSAHRQ